MSCIFWGAGAVEIQMSISLGALPTFKISLVRKMGSNIHLQLTRGAGYGVTKYHENKEIHTSKIAKNNCDLI